MVSILREYRTHPYSRWGSGAGARAPQRWKRNAIAEYRSATNQPSGRCQNLPELRGCSSGLASGKCQLIRSIRHGWSRHALPRFTRCPRRIFFSRSFLRLEVHRKKTPKVIDRKTNESCGIHSNKKTDKQERAVCWEHTRNVASVCV